MKALGIEIGRDAWRLLEVRRSLTGTRAVRRSEVSGTLGERASAIAEYISANGMSDARLGIVLPREASIIKYLEIPSPNPGAIGGIIKFEIEKYLPLAPSDYYYGYKVTGRKGNSYSVLIVAAVKKIVDEASGFFASVGIKLSFACLWHEAVLNALIHAGGKEKNHKMVLIGAGNQEITLDAFSGLSIVYSKSSGINGISFAETIQRELGGLEAFLGEKIEDFSITFSGDRGTEVFSSLKEKLKNICSKPDQKDHIEPSYLAAFGGGLAATGLGDRLINLIPQAGYHEESKYFVSILLSVFVIVLLGFAVISYVAKDVLTLKYLDKSILEFRTLKDNKEGGTNTNGTSKKISVLESIAAASSTRTLDLLKELTEKMPDDASLTSLEYRDGSVIIEGVSGNAPSLMIGLANSRLMEDFEFVAPVMRVSPGKEKFRIKSRIRGGKGNGT